MEIEETQTKNLTTHTRVDNNTTGLQAEWIDFSKDVPVGVFYCDSQAGVVHINKRMRDHLNLEQMAISPVLEEYFWARMESNSRRTRTAPRFAHRCKKKNNHRTKYRFPTSQWKKFLSSNQVI